MKRSLCLALVLSLLMAICVPPALAEEAPAIMDDEFVETEVVAADDAGDTGLTIEGAEEAPEAEEVPEEEEAPGLSLEEETEASAEEEVEAPADAYPVISAPATGIQLSAASVKIGVREKFAGLTVSPIPAGSALPAITWRSGNARIVRVDANGTLTGVKKGATYVYAKMADGSEVACKVIVLKAPKKLTVRPTKLTLGADGQTAQLRYAVPRGYASNTFTFSSSNPRVATVDATGKITTVGAGKATISVKAYNGKGGKCKLTVLGAPKTLGFSTAEFSVATGQKTKLKPVVTYTARKYANPGITYEISPNSRDAGCITLNASTGEIKGVRKGSAVIIATTYNGISASLPVTVAAAPSAITLNQSAVTIGVSNIYSGLLASLTAPAGESECASMLSWSTSNKKVAKVDANGIITGVKRGSCFITAKTVNGLTARCKVTVCKAPSRIALRPANASLYVGESDQYTVVFPRGTSGTVSFSSSNNAVATVDARGKVTAVAQGTVTITATSYNGRKSTAKLKVEKNTGVEVPPGGYDPPTTEITEYREGMSNAEKIELVIYKAQSQLGKPYIYGSGYTTADSPSGFDCSGLVYWSFLKAKIRLQATAHRQGYDSTYQKITSISSLRRGDVVCFNTVEDGADDLCDHTGIYLGSGMFIHASSSAKKVVISTLSSGYYYRTFYCGRRILS